MIRLLNAGLSVEALLDLIERSMQAPPVAAPRSSRWIT
jgi:hypothetical protein